MEGHFKPPEHQINGRQTYENKNFEIITVLKYNLSFNYCQKGKYN